jgi:hypothetical protein
MLKEALEFLVEQGTSQAEDIITAEAEPSHIYFVRTSEGLERKEADPKPRKGSADSLTAIVEFAINNKDTAEIWYNRSHVEVYLDKKTRRDVVSFKPFLSQPIQLLQELEKSKQNLTQAQLIKMLRISFYGCMDITGGLLETLKRVNFKATQEADSSIDRGKVSLGKSITAQVTGVGTIPDDFTLTVPVFGNACFASLRKPVLVALEPEATNATFQLIPYPLQVEQAIANAEDWIGSELKGRLTDAGAEVPVYFG